MMSNNFGQVSISSNAVNGENPPLYVYWRLLEACNYGCHGCNYSGAANCVPLARERLLEVATKVFAIPRRRFIFEIMGGEPTLHPNLPELISYLASSPRQTSIVLHTNGWRNMAWYKNLMAKADAQKLEIQIWPRPDHSDLRHLLFLAAEIVESGFKLAVNFGDSITPVNGIFGQAFAALAQQLGFALVLPENSREIVILGDEPKTSPDGMGNGIEVFRCIGIDEVAIDQFGHFGSDFERIDGDKMPLWTADASLLDAIAIERCSKFDIARNEHWFGSLAEAESFKANYISEQARQTIVLPAVANPLALNLTPLQSIELLARRIADGDSLHQLILAINKNSDYLSLIYSRLSDQNSLDVFSRWLRHFADIASAHQLSSPDSGEENDKCAPVCSAENLHHGTNIDESDAFTMATRVSQENWPGAHEKLHNKRKVVRLADSMQELSSAAKRQILYGKPEIQLELPTSDPIVMDTVFWCLENLKDYGWALRESDKEPGQFWLVGICPDSTSAIPDSNRPLLSVILWSPDASAENVDLLDMLLGSNLNLDIIIIAANDKATLPFEKLETHFPANLRLLKLPGIGRAQQRNTAMNVARAEYVLFSDDILALKPGILRLLTDHISKDFPDMIVCVNANSCTPDQPYAMEAKEENYIPIYESIWCSNIFRREFLLSYSLRFRDAEPFEMVLFNLEALSCANKISRSYLSMGDAATSHNCIVTSWFRNMVVLVSTLDKLCEINSGFRDNINLDIFSGKIMATFWPLIQEEFKEAKNHGKLEEIATREAFIKLGLMPQLTRWVINRIAEDYFATLTGSPIISQEKEAYFQELQLTESPHLRPDQEWEEYISPSEWRRPEAPFFSIIMPNYNKSAYLEEAVASALDQSFGDFELLIVDDASTDGSYEKCKNLADLDRRIRLWRMRHNSMQGVCRNKAIQESRGKYIIFLDSDDFLHPGFLAKARADVCCTDAQMIVYGVQEIDVQGTVQSTVRAIGADCEGDEICNAFWSNHYPWGPWAKIYDGDFVRNSRIRFEEYIYHQDVFFLTRFAMKATKITARDDIVYSCRLTPNSSVRPAKAGYRHLHSAIAKLALRNSCFENGHIHRKWFLVAQGAHYTMRMRILPTIARAFGIHGEVPMTETDTLSLARNPIAQFTLYTNGIYAGQHKPSQPTSQSAARPLERATFWKTRNKFSLPDASLLDFALDLPDPGQEPAAQASFLKVAGVFDADYYFASNEDLKESKVDPHTHYCERWQEEQWRDPAPWFSTRAYLTAYRDVASSGMNPFIHYIVKGRQEGRKPKPEIAVGSDVPMYCRDFDSLLMHRPEPGTILLVEANNCHCDIPPGWVNYFTRLGYKINAIILPSQAAFDPFCRCQNPALQCWAIPYHEIGYFLQNCSFVSQYEYVFFNSYTIYRGLNSVCKLSVFEHFPKMITPKNGFLAVMHHMELWDKNKIARDRIITLTDTDGDELVVNPHHFGDVKITGKHTDKTRFIVVGAMESERKNIPLLLDAAKELLNRSCTNFRITFIGRGILQLPPELAKNVEVLGETSYPEMFKKMEDACFFLPMLDPENPAHERYLTTAISGSFMLCYCFRKPMIIAKKFAAKYGLNNENALVYNENRELTDTLEKAIKMNITTHWQLCKNIGILSDKITKKSMKNLERIVHKFQ